MKRILLSTAAVALLLTTACTNTTEETNVNATDTVNMLPPADNTGPGIEGANPEMRDPNAVDMNGNTTGSNPSGGSTPSGGSSSNTGSSTSGSNSASGSSNSGSQDVVVPATTPNDAVKSTYKRAAPGDTVDSRTNIGSSR